MKILYLPGFSLKSKTEAVLNTSTLKEAGYDAFIREWRHWKDQSEIIKFASKEKFPTEIQWDAGKEIDKIKSEVDLNSPISIIAKSIGTYIAACLIPDANIERLILMGIPVNDLDESELQKYQNLKNLNCSISLIQNINDNHGSLEQVENLLKGINYQLISKDSEDHSYNYPDEIRFLLE